MHCGFIERTTLGDVMALQCLFVQDENRSASLLSRIPQGKPPEEIEDFLAAIAIVRVWHNRQGEAQIGRWNGQAIGSSALGKRTSVLVLKGNPKAVRLLLRFYVRCAQAGTAENTIVFECNC